MRCYNCGKKLVKHSKYCSYCGLRRQFVFSLLFVRVFLVVLIFLFILLLIMLGLSFVL